MSLTNPSPGTEQATVRPLFLYGTLRAIPLLASVVTGDPRKKEVVEPLLKPAQLKGYARFSIIGLDYPALVKHDDENSTVDGLLFFPQDEVQRRKLDEFEGNTYTATQVQVIVIGEENEIVDADVYVYCGSDQVSTLPWDFDTFMRESLDYYVNFVSCVEFTGGSSSP